MDPAEMQNKADISPAIRRLQNKHEIPTIDFTMFKMDDGSMVSTKERVIKGPSLPMCIEASIDTCPCS